MKSMPLSATSNQFQRKYLRERFDAHAHTLRNKIYEIDRPEPPRHIARAMRLVKVWNLTTGRERDRKRSQLTKKLEKVKHHFQKIILFDSPETALAAIELFEKCNLSTLRVKSSHHAR